MHSVVYLLDVLVETQLCCILMLYSAGTTAFLGHLGDEVNLGMLSQQTLRHSTVLTVCSLLTLSAILTALTVILQANLRTPIVL